MTLSSAQPVGEIAKLRKHAAEIPPEAARTVRELAQKEYESDVRAHDALLSRGNQLLAASAVAVSLLVGLTKDAAIDRAAEKILLVAALTVAGIMASVVVCALRIRSGKHCVEAENLFGTVVPPLSDEREPPDWIRDYELMLAVHYVEISGNIRERHASRATLLQLAQGGYVVFLVLVAALGIIIAT